MAKKKQKVTKKPAKQKASPAIQPNKQDYALVVAATFCFLAVSFMLAVALSYRA